MVRAEGTLGASRRFLLLSPLVGLASLGWVTAAMGGLPSEKLELSDTLRIGEASIPLLPDSVFRGWTPLAFGGDRGLTLYRGAVVAGRQCLRAEALAGGSGLIRLVDAAPDSFPLIQWDWWVEDAVPGGDLEKKEGDDFAARIYVNFRFEPSKAGPLHRIRQRLANRRFGGEAPGKALVYVWGNRAPVGTIARSAYTDQAALVVLHSGGDEAGRWWTEVRNLSEDFREAFGEEPPKIHSIAIMTDADDTGASASACYGDILLLPPAGSF